MPESIYTLLILSIAVASIAWTVTQEEIFAEPREFCLRRSEHGSNLIARKFFYVFTCEYCFSHWAGLFIIAITGFHLIFADWRGYLIAFFVLSWLANQWMSLYRRLRVGIKYGNALAENEEVSVNSSENSK